MPWAKVTLTNQDITEGKHFQLQNAFERMFMAAIGPKDAAMFTQREFSEPHYFYFSPGAVQIFDAILRVYKASSCDAPSIEDVTLLVGHAGAADALLISRANTPGQ